MSSRLTRHDETFPHSFTSSSDTRSHHHRRHPPQHYDQIRSHSRLGLRSTDYSSRYSDPDSRLFSDVYKYRNYSGETAARTSSQVIRTSQEELRKQGLFDVRTPGRHRLASDPDYRKELKSRSYDNLFSSGQQSSLPPKSPVRRESSPLRLSDTSRHRRAGSTGSSHGSDVFETLSGRQETSSDTMSVTSDSVVMKPDKSPRLHRTSPKIGGRDPKLISPLVYRPRPRSIATDIGYSSKIYSDHLTAAGPISPEYDSGYRSSTSNLLHGNIMQSGLRSVDSQSGDVRKWGSCSRLEYNGQPGSYGHHPVPGHERTEGDGGPASYPEPVYNPYRRHSSSKVSSHSSNSDEVILAQKAELEEKNRVIESLKMRVSDADSKLAERAYSDKSGELGAVAESLDSGIDIRSDTGVMKPLYGGVAQRTAATLDERNEVARLRLYVKQLESRIDSGVSSSYEEDGKLESLMKENQRVVEEKTSISRKFARLQDYLTTLPTVNEYSELKEKLNQLTEENTNLQEEQKRAGESSKDAKQKESELKKYQRKCTDMRDSIQKLEKQNNLLKSQNANQAKQELQKVEQEKARMEKKMEHVKKEIAVLSEQKESTKNLVGGYYEKYSNEQEKTRILAESLDRSVMEVSDLKGELDSKTRQVDEVEGRVVELEHELGAVLLKVEEYQHREMGDVENSELLMAEYNAAFQDLNSIVEACHMRVEGKQMDISLLLGLGASPRPSSVEDLSVETQLKNIQLLRSNIDLVRAQVSDLYAEDIGSQCPTQ